MPDFQFDVGEARVDRFLTQAAQLLVGIAQPAATHDELVHAQIPRIVLSRTLWGTGARESPVVAPVLPARKHDVG